MAGWHVTANDIKNWTATEKRKAEEVLPLLIKKLILASCKPKEIDFPSGDTIAVGGWDGRLDVDLGTDFVPRGKSGWEIGTDYAVKSKADGDYSKRLEDPSPFDLNETTFVFATSRLWTKRDEWVLNKQSDNKWKDIKGIDARTLENWLGTCPAVHRWFAEMLGKRSASLWDVEQAWHEFVNKTGVNLTAEFLLHEREEEFKAIESLFLGPPSIHRIKSASKAEAYGFTIASLVRSDSANARCLIVKSQAAWDLSASSDQNLILIPYGFLPNGMGAAVSNGHTILVAVDYKDTHSESIFLRQQPRLVRQEGLKKLGFDDEAVSRLYAETKGYLEPLLRNPLLQPIDYATPSWPEKTSTDVLFAAFFASEWDENNDHDMAAIETLAGITYPEFQKVIINLSKEDDPPIRLVGKVWQIISKMDFWLFIAPMIAKPYLDRLGEVLPTVLADYDPSFDLPPDERYMASIKGAVPKYSTILKHGLADSVALLAAYGDDYADQLGGEKLSAQICYWIKKLFQDNTDVRFWYSLNTCMQLLAEAAPEEFMEAVEKASQGNSPILLGLFEAEEEGTFGGCYHSNLLWSLEQISWNKQHLARVSLCLARLSEIDPGGRWSNRPFSSLVDIYLCWINNTSASHEERITILDKLLIPQFPGISWRLMLSLLINKSHTTSVISKPEYREWAQDVERSTSTKAYYDYVSAIVDLLLRELDNGKSERLCDLVDNFDSYRELQQRTVLDRLLSQDVDKIEEDTRDQILRKLRETLSHHREFPEAGWSWPANLLDHLEEVYNHFDYEDPFKANIFLFNDHWPKLIEPIKRKEVDYEEREALVLEKRIATVEGIYADQGVDGLVRLMSECSYPGIVGHSIYNSSIAEALLNSAMDWVGEDGVCGVFSDSFFTAFTRDNLTKAVSLLKETDSWAPAKKAQFLLCFPLSADTFALVEELPPEGKSHFWTRLTYYFISDKNVKLVSYIASKLLENNRPLAAIDALAQVFHRGDASQIDGSLVEKILIRIATDPADIKQVAIQNVQHAILKAIEFIQDSSGLEAESIRRLEWAYLRIFRFERFPPRYLSKYVAESPDFFAQLVSWVYRRSDDNEDPKEELTEDQVQQRAEIAWELLRTISILPGAKGDAIDPHVLNGWVDSARAILKETGRADIGDDQIGAYLSRSPIGNDGIWPHESVRTVIERIKSEKIDDAIRCGRRNYRGVTTRHPYAGGEQERKLAQAYYNDAGKIQLVSPRTAGMLRAIAKSYEWEAEREDQAVEIGR